MVGFRTPFLDTLVTQFRLGIDRYQNERPLFAQGLHFAHRPYAFDDGIAPVFGRLLVKLVHDIGRGVFLAQIIGHEGQRIPVRLHAPTMDFLHQELSHRKVRELPLGPEIFHYRALACTQSACDSNNKHTFAVFIL